MVRTCIGCRRRDGQAALLRVAVGAPASGPAQDWVLVPDPRRRRPGRGAYVHPTPECVQLAITRKAFGRALRQPGVPDSMALQDLVRQRT